MRVTITETATGKTKRIDSELSEFMWTEGNYSCDCNRHNIFHDVFEGTDCGDDMRYTIRIHDDTE